MLKSLFYRTKKLSFLNGFNKLIIGLIIFSGALFFSTKSISAATYYVDATNGLDTNAGTSTDQAWQTLNKVNISSFLPGDQILFKKGEIWREELVAPSSGESGNPITFSAYGDGDNPIFDGSEIITGSWTQYVSNGYLTGYSNSIPNQLSDGASRNYRNIIPADSSSVDGTKIRITIKASDSGDGGTIADASIAPMTTGATFDSSPIPITWDGGSASVTVSSGQTKVSDEITISFDKTKRYGVHFWTTDRDFFLSGSAGGMYGMSNNSTSEADTLSPASTSLINGPFALSLLEVYTTSSPEGVWYQALESDPLLIWDNDTALTRDTTISNVVSNQNYSAYVGGNIYIHTSDNTNPNTNGRTYEYAARTETFVDDGNDWLILDGIDQRKTSGDTTTIGGIKNTGSNNIFRNLKSYDHYRHSFCFYNGAQNNLVTNIEAYNSHSTTPICIYQSGGTITTNNLLTNSIIHNENATLGGSCIVAHGGSTGNTVSGNNIYGSDSSVATGLINIYDTDTSLRVTKNYLHGVAYGGGIYIHNGADSSQIDYNIIDMSQFVNQFSVHTAIHSLGATNTKIYNNTIYGNNGNSAIHLSNNSTGTEVKNNIIYGTNAYAFVDSGSITNTTLNNNLVYNLANPTGSWNGNTYSSFSDWQTGTSQDLNSLNSNPLFTDYGSSDVTLTSSSPAINTGTSVSLTSDYSNNLFYDEPDIGAYEYQPPYEVSTNEIDIDGDIRIYADGKFRNTQTASGTTANLSISPSGGFNSSDSSVWMDLSISQWNTSGDYAKTWTESSDTIGTDSTVHTVGDLEANGQYVLKVDDVQGADITSSDCTDGVCTANGSGEIAFTYTGGYSSHTFSITEYVAPTPTPTPSPSNNSNDNSSSNSTPSAPTCTDTSPAGQPDLFQIDRTGNQAKLYFTPVNDHVESYHVIFGFHDGDERFGGINMPAMNENEGVQSIVVDNLDPKATYSFKVVSVNGCAAGEWSNWLEAGSRQASTSIFYRYWDKVRNIFR